MRIVTPDEKNGIYLGRQGENLATQVQFDVNVAGWVETYGVGTWQLLNRRPSDPAGYPVEISVEDNIIKWDLTATDLKYAGCGTCELVYYVDEVIAKSIIYGTQILPAIDGTGEIPEPWESWIDEVEQARDDAQAAAEAAAGSASSAEGFAQDASASAAEASDSAYAAGQSADAAEDSADTAKDEADRAAELADQIEHSIDDIEALIPPQASPENQLADKNFVNSSISTNTANYISNNGQPFTSVAQLEAYSGPVSNNDYAFVTGTDSAGNTFYDRYKATVSEGVVSWAFEYRLNNSSFTAAQWAAIESGITASQVADYNAHLANESNPHNVTKAQVGLGNVDNTPDAQKPVSQAQAAALALKADKVADAVAGDFAALDANGNLADSGISKEISEQLEGALVSFKAAYAVPLKALSVALSPIQDLHGYASPWPAGGGKNKFGLKNVSAIANGTNKTLTVVNEKITVAATGAVASTGIIGNAAMPIAIENATLKAGTYYFKIFDFVASAFPAGTQNNFKVGITTGGVTTDYAPDTAIVLSADSTIEYISSPTLQWNSGNTMSFYAAIATENLTAWQPYSNVCPIFGHTEVEITRAGKNLFAQPNGTNTFSGVTEKWTDGVLVLTASSATGEISSAAANWRNAGACYLKAGTYKAKATQDGTSSGSIAAYLVNYMDGSRIQGMSWGVENTFTLEEDTAVCVSFYLYQFLSTGGKTVNVSVVKSSDSADYEKSNVKKVLFDIGINQWDEEWEVGDYDDTTGQPIFYNSKIRSKSTSPIPVTPGATYCLYAGTSRISVVYWYDANDAFISRTANADAIGTVTSPAGAYFMRFKCADGYGTTYNNDLSINYPARFKDYYAYTGRGIVYGGTLDVQTGVLTIDRLQITMDNKTSISVGTSGAGVKYADIGSPLNLVNNSYLTAISSAYKVVPQISTAATGEFKVYGSAITVFDNGFTDAATAEALLRANAFEAVVKTLNMRTVQLTPAQVETLVGINNVYADNGPVTLERWKGLGEIIAAVHEALSA